MIQCPVEGCDFTGQQTAVRGHWGGKRDGKHQGDFHKALQAFEDARDESASVETDTDADESEDKPNRVTDPARETPPAESQSQATDGSQQSSEVDGCPDCSGELVDFSDLESGRYHDGVQFADGSQGMFVGGDYLCSECGEWWMDE
jgi:hypothetical protein